MWQILLAAAIAGSGFVAKRFLSETVTDSELNEPKFDQIEAQNHSQPQISKEDDCNSNAHSSIIGDDSPVFLFSSSESRCGDHRPRHGSTNAGNKFGRGIIRVNVKKSSSSSRCCVGGDIDVVNGVDADRRSRGKRISVSLKKRRTRKNDNGGPPGKCDSCFSKDNSVFGWGLGIGMMYMMSSGKSEISKLNAAMDETAKVVQDLKSELCKRKSLHNLHVTSFGTEVDTNSKRRRAKHVQTTASLHTNEERVNSEIYGCPLTEEGEFESRVLTDEPRREVLEMHELQAELESELDKLSRSAKEASNKCESEFSGYKLNDLKGEIFNSHQLRGVLPSELDQKLCHVLIERQDNQIVMLESELQQAHSKLQEKETELQSLKNCVRRLTEFSLSTAADEEETEAALLLEKKSEEIYYKKTVVGMERATMEFDLHSSL